MLKRDELTNPMSCMCRARDDEMTFVLLERDIAAPATLWEWIHQRQRHQKNTPIDGQIQEASRTIAYIRSLQEKQGLPVLPMPIWSDETCFKLNAGQHNRRFHPYTCGNDSRHTPLIATRYGWRCADCDYTQHSHHGAPPSGHRTAGG